MRLRPPRALARLLVRTSARALERLAREPQPRPAAPRPERFDVYTFVTDEEQYRALRASFEAAGFEEPSTRFVRLHDRRRADGSDPYALISRLGRDGGDAYPVLVHQDVRLDQGHGRAELVAALEALTARDARWAVAGTAGTTAELRSVRRIRDPYGGSTAGPLPARVVALDENFLVLNPAAGVTCSPQLDGFHFYGTDVCLRAIAAGGTCYLVDFPVTHLGRGRLDRDYEEAKRRLVDAWQGRFRLAFLLTPTGPLLLTRSRVLRRLLGSARLAAWVARRTP